jgi:hypothetical protein
MNIKRRILGAVIAAAGITQLAVAVAPGADPIQYVIPAMKYGALAIIFLAGVSIYYEDELNNLEKRLLMNGFFLAILVPSFLAAGAFLHDSQTTWSNGEIHWHADFEVLVENDQGAIEELDLVDPAKFCEDTSHESSYMCKINDRTGSTEYHEHNDDRIHLEGSFKTRRDASLAAFFEQFKGELTSRKMVFPTNDETVEVRSNDEKTLKILVQKGVGGSRHWCAVGSDVPEQELCRSHGVDATSTERYIISPYTQNPSGSSPILDNIFIVYDSNSLEEALQDVREDNEYRGRGLTKEGSSYG